MESDWDQIFDSIEVYQMPKSMGNDWAFSGYGIMSDGYKSKEEATRCAYKGFVRFALTQQLDEIEKELVFNNGITFIQNKRKEVTND